jgi:hypothetical protein
MDSMFGLNWMSLVVNTTESDELNNDCNSKNLRRNHTPQQTSSGMSEDHHRATLMNADDAVQLRHGYSKRSRERKNELKIAQRNVYQDAYQEQAFGMEEDGNSYEFMNNLGCWAEEGTETNSIEEPKMRVRKTGRRLERELRMANRLLAFERSQKHALQERLVDVENQLMRIQKVDEDCLNQKYGQKSQAPNYLGVLLDNFPALPTFPTVVDKYSSSKPNARVQQARRRRQACWHDDLARGMASLAGVLTTWADKPNRQQPDAYQHHTTKYRKNNHLR